MTQDQIDRFIKECETRFGLGLNKTDRALLECFRQWYAYDLLVTEQRKGVTCGQN